MKPETTRLEKGDDEAAQGADNSGLLGIEILKI